ncbi:MAG TPA: SH3 domain-containing protein [Candidatus Krumholzibacteria bacterium]|nr:SH3 domain-containing protein [Candidatus Krumholzibacteria bacterium]HPD71868.1 SH3 domain-containing protein [Candidatus Krumholzibacteria bacterium]HRY41199.1 SH3 domain-containing protein [Candidatus Krumholzibacteria bacterium]
MSRRTLGALVALLLLCLTALAAQQFSVQVRETRLRQTPSYLGATTASVTYGTRVTVLETRGPWRRVQATDGRTGWLHESALTERQLTLAAGDRDVATGADTDEIALAGKGFSPEVEREFKKQNRDVDFAWVDRMATWNVTPDEALAFLAEGKVTPPGGQP